jgi:antirestriction protein
MTTQLAERPNTEAVTDTPRIYVACLASYNAGRLHGAWMDVGSDVDDLHASIRGVLASSPEPDAEEWAIHDYEGFGEYRVSEYADLDKLVTIAGLIEEHGEIITHLIDHFGGDIDAATQAMEEEYQGCFYDLEHYAEQFMEDTGSLQNVPRHLHNYIDYEAMGRDMELNGDVFTIELGYREVHVFWNR